MALSDKDYWNFKDQQAAAERRRVEQEDRQRRDRELDRMRQQQEEERQRRFRENEARCQQQSEPGRRRDAPARSGHQSSYSGGSEMGGGCILVALAIGLLAGLGYYILMRAFLWIPLGVSIAIFILWGAWRSALTARYRRSIWRWTGVACLLYLAILIGQLMYWWWGRTHPIVILPTNPVVSQPAKASKRSRPKRSARTYPSPTPTASSP